MFFCFEKKFYYVTIILRGVFMEEVSVKKKMSASKIALIVIGCIVAIFVIWVFVVANNELEAEDKLIAMRDYILETDDIDMSIESKGEYAKIEKIMKEYHQTYLEYYQEVEENDYIAIYNMITSDFLTNHVNDLPKLLNGLDTYLEKVNHGIDGMIQLLDEEEIELLFIEADIDYYYLDFYKELMILDSDEETLSGWLDYKQENEEKMKYVKEMIRILVTYPEEWYVEDDTLYFIDDKLLEQYNTYYYLTFDEESTSESVSM